MALDRLADRKAFIREQTRLQAPPLVPEISLYLADEVVPLWQLTEEELEAQGVPPPYWAFAWAGGQALARFVLDNPGCVEAKSVIDFGAGSGLTGLAALRAGARSCLAADTDRLAEAAAFMNAEANGLTLEATTNDLLDDPPLGADVILVGDMFYERPLAERLRAWLRGHLVRGAQVFVGDPERNFFSKAGLELLATYQVQTTRELEDREIRRTSVWRMVG